MGNTNQPESDAPRNQPTDYLAYPESYGPFWNSDSKATGRVQVAKTGLASAQANPQQTIPDIFAQVAKKKGNKIAMRTENMPMIEKGAPVPEVLPESEWKKWTYKAYLQDSRSVAKAMIAYGLERGDSVNIFGFNSPEWFIGMMGAVLAGGKAAGIYPSDNEEQLQYKSHHSNGSVAFVETADNLRKFKAIADDIPYMKVIVCWACNPGADIKRADGTKIATVTFTDFLKKGLTQSDESLEERILDQQPGDCCALIYTSGTTGRPKAVMITHDNLVYESMAFVKCIGNGVGAGGEERILSYLPLSHVAGMMVDIICPVVLSAKYKGWANVTFARPYDLKAGTIGDRLRFTQPTIFLGVPRVWEKIQEKLKKVGAQTKGLRKKLAEGAKAKSAIYQTEQQLGKSGKKPKSLVFYNILLGKIKQKLGLDKCKFAFAGAAPMTKELLEYFGSIGININEVYGMSECTGAVTVSTDAHHVYGSVGYEMPGCELKIFKVDPDDINKKVECPDSTNIFKATEEEQGEICFRGRNIMLGYMANPKLGKEHVEQIEGKNMGAIDNDGWLHSGDKGTRDIHGMVKITGRYKELIIGAGGENIAPVPIEDNLKKVLPAISNVMMVGNKRKYNVAVLTLKAVGATGELPGGNDLEAEALEVSGAKTIPEAMNDKAFIDYLVAGFKATNANGDVVPSNAAKIQKFSILPRDFSVETEELTATLKLKRSIVEKQYADIIEAMYDPANKDMYVHYQVAPNVNIPIGFKPRGPVESVELKGFGLESVVEETEVEVEKSVYEED